MEEKSIFRKRFLKERQRLNPKEVMERSLRIQECVLASRIFFQSSVIALYQSIRNEVQTDLLFEEGIRQRKTLLYPKVDLKRQKINFHCVTARDQFALGTFRILEPISDSIYEAQPVEFVAIPCLGVDRLGNRLGYGGGYYDRWLKGKNPFRLGLVYSFQCVDRLPAEKGDFSLNAVVTEQGWMEINPHQEGGIK
ncbi:MAG: 5-formyltetrahydrofolate cyclo-ligase [Deltaproteobacteria bacterium]|nr:5-formyltetrahydrofolate cyclo-ligase [Deltaproteobacteria bacterium]